VIDAVRCARLALERGQAGPIEAPSAYFMKSPPRQMRDSVAHDACEAFIAGEDTKDGVVAQVKMTEVAAE
jgi:myo-inositol-1-phosphate synthase